LTDEVEDHCDLLVHHEHWSMTTGPLPPAVLGQQNLLDLEQELREGGLLSSLQLQPLRLTLDPNTELHVGREGTKNIISIISIIIIY